jgi:hypothetical protein
LGLDLGLSLGIGRSAKFVDFSEKC